MGRIQNLLQNAQNKTDIELISDDVTKEAIISTCSKPKKFTLRTTERPTFSVLSQKN